MEFEPSIYECMCCCSNPKVKCKDQPKIYYKTNNPTIFVLGHSPKQEQGKTKAKYVLKMNEKSSPLRRYILEDILDPINGKDKSEIYCSNAIKCITDRMPDKDRKFMKDIFQNCIINFEREIESIKPRLIICISEAGFDLLNSNYEITPKAKVVPLYGTLYQIIIKNKVYFLIPVRHKKQIERRYYDEQKRLISNCIIRQENGWKVRNDLSMIPTPPAILDDSCEAQISGIIRWFKENFQEPSDGVPYEGGYVFYNGGPFNPYDVLCEEFDDVEEELLEEAANRLFDESLDWEGKNDY